MRDPLYQVRDGLQLAKDGCQLIDALRLEALSRAEQAEQQNITLRKALDAALAGWDYAASYKGEYLSKKHGDAEDIARPRKLLE